MKTLLIFMVLFGGMSEAFGAQEKVANSKGLLIDMYSCTYTEPPKIIPGKASVKFKSKVSKKDICLAEVDCVWSTKAAKFSSESAYPYKFHAEVSCLPTADGICGKSENECVYDDMVAFKNSGEMNKSKSKFKNEKATKEDIMKNYNKAVK